MGGKKTRENYIDFARAVACMLIVNSHFDGVYPIDISWGGTRELPVFSDLGLSACRVM